MSESHHSKWLVVTGSSLLLLLLSACVSAATACDAIEPVTVTGEQADLVDRSLITQEPCKSPCWYGIIPGVTSHTEALAIVKDLDFIDPNSVVETQYEPKSIIWKTVFPEDQRPATGIYLDEHGIVSGISMYRLWYKVTIQEVIDAIGEPDGITTRGYGPPERTCNHINVVWFEEGLEVTVANQPPTNIELIEIESDFPIYSILYFPAASSLDEKIAIEGDSTFRNRFKEWEGFIEK